MQTTFSFPRRPGVGPLPPTVAVVLDAYHSRDPDWPVFAAVLRPGEVDVFWCALVASVGTAAALAAIAELHAYLAALDAACAAALVSPAA